MSPKTKKKPRTKKSIQHPASSFEPEGRSEEAASEEKTIEVGTDSNSTSSDVSKVHQRNLTPQQEVGEVELKTSTYQNFIERVSVDSTGVNGFIDGLEDLGGPLIPAEHPGLEFLNRVSSKPELITKVERQLNTDDLVFILDEGFEIGFDSDDPPESHQFGHVCFKYPKGALCGSDRLWFHGGVPHIEDLPRIDCQECIKELRSMIDSAGFKSAIVSERSERIDHRPSIPKNKELLLSLLETFLVAVCIQVNENPEGFNADSFIHHLDASGLGRYLQYAKSLIEATQTEETMADSLTAFARDGRGEESRERAKGSWDNWDDEEVHRELNAASEGPGLGSDTLQGDS